MLIEPNIKTMISWPFSYQKKKKKAFFLERIWKPARQFDDARALGLRVVNATEDGENSTHGWAGGFSLSLSLCACVCVTENGGQNWEWRLGLGRESSGILWYYYMIAAVDSDSVFQKIPIPFFFILITD